METTALDYRSPSPLHERRSTSATISVVASAVAIVVGVAAYAMTFLPPGPKSIFDGMAMGFVLFFVCAPAFVVAGISAIVSARSHARRGQMPVIAWLLVVVQGIFWIVMIAGSVMNASSSSASHGAPGGF